MRYPDITEGKFIDRPNRFVAHVEINGHPETVHVKNTGRCRELLLPGSRVILNHSDNPNRKTAYDLVAVYKESLGLVNIDSQAPNQVMKEWLLSQGFDVIHPEYTYGNSRMDFYMERMKAATKYFGTLSSGGERVHSGKRRNRLFPGCSDPARRKTSARTDKSCRRRVPCRRWPSSFPCLK